MPWVPGSRWEPHLGVPGPDGRECPQRPKAVPDRIGKRLFEVPISKEARLLRAVARVIDLGRLIGQAYLDPAQRAVVGHDKIPRQDLQWNHAGAARGPVARAQAGAER